MMKSFPTMLGLMLLAGGTASALSDSLFNGGFEEPDAAFGPTSPEGWNFLNFGNGPDDDDPTDDFIRRRTIDDGQLPANPPVRSGVASLMLSGGGTANFRGVLNSNGTGDLGSIDRRLSYVPFGQEVRITGWFNIPASSAWQVQRPGFKIEFRRPNGEAFNPTGGAAVGPEFFFVDPVINGGTGHTNGEWQRFEFVFDHWYTEQFQRRYGDGSPGDPNDPQGTIFFLLPFLFGGQNSDEGAPDFIGNETGAVFYDDFTYEFEIGNTSPQQNRTLYGDRQLQIEVELDESIVTPDMPVFFNQSNPDTPAQGTPPSFWASNYWDRFNAAWDFDGVVGDENWTTVNIYDRVPGWDQDATGQFQFQDGWFGYPLTWSDVVVEGRLYPRVQSDDGGVANLVNRTGSSGSATTGVVTAPSYETNPLNFPTYDSADIRVTSAEPGVFEVRSTTEIVVSGTYPNDAASLDAVRDYNTDAQVGSTSNTFSYTFTTDSAIMLSGSFRLATIESFFTPSDYFANSVSVNGTTVDLSAITPGNQIFGTPVAFAVGDTVTVASDPGATPSDSPTVSLTLDSLSGAAGLGVQGLLMANGNLDVWVEWTGAPATIPVSTTIEATFTVTATTPNEVVICDGDANADGAVNVQDFIAVLLNFGSTGSTGDANGDGAVNVQDFIAVLLNFGSTCS